MITNGLIRAIMPRKEDPITIPATVRRVSMPMLFSLSCRCGAFFVLHRLVLSSRDLACSFFSICDVASLFDMPVRCTKTVCRDGFWCGGGGGLHSVLCMYLSYF